MNERKLPQRVLNCKSVVDSQSVKRETFVPRMDNVTCNVAWQSGSRRGGVEGQKTHFLKSVANNPKTGG